MGEGQGQGKGPLLPHPLPHPHPLPMSSRPTTHRRRAQRLWHGPRCYGQLGFGCGSGSGCGCGLKRQTRWGDAQWHRPSRRAAASVASCLGPTYPSLGTTLPGPGEATMCVGWRLAGRPSWVGFRPGSWSFLGPAVPSSGHPILGLPSGPSLDLLSSGLPVVLTYRGMSKGGAKGSQRADFLYPFLKSAVIPMGKRLNPARPTFHEGEPSMC